MDWGPLVSTSLGAVIGIASTLATDQIRTKRGREDKDQAARQQLYGDYLAALARTRNHLRMAARPSGLPDGERVRRAAEAFHEGNAYELRYQIAVVAPREVVEASTAAFRSLRDLRDLMEGGSTPYQSGLRAGPGQVGAPARGVADRNEAGSRQAGLLATPASPRSRSDRRPVGRPRAAGPACGA